MKISVGKLWGFQAVLMLGLSGSWVSRALQRAMHSTLSPPYLHRQILTPTYIPQAHCVACMTVKTEVVQKSAGSRACMLQRSRFMQVTGTSSAAAWPCSSVRASSAAAAPFSKGWAGAAPSPLAAYLLCSRLKYLQQRTHTSAQACLLQRAHTLYNHKPLRALVIPVPSI